MASQQEMVNTGAQVAVQKNVSQDPREQIQRLASLAYLTTDPQVLEAFKKMIFDDKGEAYLVSDQRLVKLEKAVILLGGVLNRTGFLTPKEAKIQTLKITRELLFTSSIQNEDDYDPYVEAIGSYLELHLEQAVKDNVGGWRAKVATTSTSVTEVKASGERKKNFLKEFFGGLIG